MPSPVVSWNERGIDLIDHAAAPPIGAVMFRSSWLVSCRAGPGLGKRLSDENHRAAGHRATGRPSSGRISPLTDAASRLQPKPSRRAAKTDASAIAVEDHCQATGRSPPVGPAA